MKKTIKTLFIVALILLTISARQHPEKYYQDKYCRGQKEVVLADKTRCDCLTDTHALEFDFSDKWAESLTQSLHYARLTGKKPGIVLILEKESDWRHLEKLLAIVIEYRLPVDVWFIVDGKLTEFKNENI